jgi:hypothetical protein
MVDRYRGLIEADVKADTHKLDSIDAFEHGAETLKAFAERRRQVVSTYPAK